MVMECMKRRVEGRGGREGRRKNKEKRKKKNSRKVKWIKIIQDNLLH